MKDRKMKVELRGPGTGLEGQEEKVTGAEGIQTKYLPKSELSSVCFMGAGRH